MADKKHKIWWKDKLRKRIPFLLAVARPCPFTTNKYSTIFQEDKESLTLLLASIPLTTNPLCLTVNSLLQDLHFKS